MEVGGAERCLTELAIRVDRGRFEPVVYSLAPRPGPARYECVRRLETASVATHFLNARGVRHLPQALRRLRRLLARQQPRVVQTFSFHANILGPLAAPAVARPGVVSGIRVAEPTRRWRHHLDAGPTDSSIGTCVSVKELRDLPSSVWACRQRTWS